MKPSEVRSSDPSDVYTDASTEAADTCASPYAPGARISENIELVRLLGTGGMGNVWLAEHAGLGTQVAVKFMSKQLVSEPGLLERFSREAKVSARIKSPHVVQIFDFATTTEGVPYIVMEQLEGQDLESRLLGGPELGLDDASRVIVQLCKALGKAHGLGIIHRDIKPDNVFLVDNEGEILVKVLDFGIAKDESQITGITVSGTTMGTPSYMSPEQLFETKEVDFHSDLWSAAVVAYRCLTGGLPFVGTSFGSVCVAINTGLFPPATQVSPRLPPGLDAWFNRALQLRPQDRFGSAAEMADSYLAELDRAGYLPTWAALRRSSGEIKSYTTDAGGISGGAITLQPPRRRRTARWVGAALALLVLAAAAVMGVKKPVRERVTGWGRVHAAGLLSRVEFHWMPPSVLAVTEEPPSQREGPPVRFLPPPSPPLAARPEPAAHLQDM